MNIFSFWQSLFVPYKDPTVALTEYINQLKVDLIAVTGQLSEDYKEVASSISEARKNKVPVSEFEINLGEEAALRRALNQLHHFDFVRGIVDNALSISPDATNEKINNSTTIESVSDWIVAAIANLQSNKNTLNFNLDDSFESLGFDILDIAELILLAETHYEIEIPDTHVVHAKTVEDLIELVYTIKSLEE